MFSVFAYSNITAFSVIHAGSFFMLGLLLYWMFGMPIIGVVFLVNAWESPRITNEKTISEEG